MMQREFGRLWIHIDTRDDGTAWAFVSRHFGRRGRRFGAMSIRSDHANEAAALRSVRRNLRTLRDEIDDFLASDKAPATTEAP